MKELKLYQCELCGTKYADRNQAKKCERYHTKDIEIVKCKYRGMNECEDRFPVHIWVQSKDGREAMYKR